MSAPSSHSPRATLERSCALKALLTWPDAVANTRFAACARRQAPLDQAKLALLLMTCGYKVRLHGDTVDVFTTTWVPAQVPRVGETALAYLGKQCALLRPAGLMNPDDERLESVFVPLG